MRLYEVYCFKWRLVFSTNLWLIRDPSHPTQWCSKGHQSLCGSNSPYNTTPFQLLTPNRQMQKWNILAYYMRQESRPLYHCLMGNVDLQIYWVTKKHATTKWITCYYHLFLPTRWSSIYEDSNDFTFWGRNFGTGLFMIFCASPTSSHLLGSIQYLII